ncbi:MAG: ion transporter [Flavobacteriales bacterium]|nr:ion transporter [Flavobacteriales bacterium]
MNNLKLRLHPIVEDNSSRYGKIFDWIIQILIFVSLIAFALETLPDLSAENEERLEMIELFCVVVFTIEYALRIFVAKKPLKYIFSFYGIIDLLAILSFYLRMVADLRALRAFRVIRIFRALKLVRYNRALRRFHIAYTIVREETVLFLVVTCIMIFLSASGIYYFEKDAQPEAFASVFHSLWWSVITLTTVGYGDVYPINTGGKVFTFFILLMGLGIVTVPAGLSASALSKARILEQKEHLKEEEEREGE